MYRHTKEKEIHHIEDIIKNRWKCKDFSLQNLSDPLSGFTYICVLNEKMFAAAFPLHREHITMFLLTLPHQEVSIILQQLLDLQSGNGSVVPVLLPQRTINLVHWNEDRKLLEAGTAKSRVFKADMYDETIGCIFKWICRDYMVILQRGICNTSKSNPTTLHASRVPQRWEKRRSSSHFK